MPYTESNRRAANQSIRVAIIGSGFGGLCMAIRLKQAGVEQFTVLEAADGIGGTWRDNHYPGATCDVPSHLYSYSFAPKPDWKRAFAPQTEILAYMQDCVARFGLQAHLQFNSAVSAARFDAERTTWVLTLHDGRMLTADVVVSATGGLSRPAYPDIPGLDCFAGPVFHSARWRQDIDLSGERVAVIGTGASAIQFVPQIAPEVAQLTLFQRTPPWVLPKPDHAIPRWQQHLYRLVPPLQRLHRASLYWLHESRAMGFVLHPRLMTLPTLLARRHIRKTIADPALRAKLTPHYVMGCKRILLSNDYYPALNRVNVELVTEGIHHVTATGLVTHDDRHHEADVIILGTGFQAAEAMSPFPIHGLHGQDLDTAWQQGAEAYLGIAMAGFPNLFLIVGPNTGLGHSSMILMIEAQVNYILDALRQMATYGVRSLAPKLRVQHGYNRQLQQQLERTVWATGCASWYRTRNGKNTTLWPGFTFEYRARTRKLQISDYDLSR